MIFFPRICFAPFKSCVATMLRTAQSQGATTQQAILKFIGKKQYYKLQLNYHITLICHLNSKGWLSLLKCSPTIIDESADHADRDIKYINKLK